MNFKKTHREILLMFYVKLVNVLLEFGHGKLSTCPGKVMDFCNIRGV
jgi:hypothetical protein